MKTAIQELIHFIEKDKMQPTYTKEQILELLNFKLEKEKEQIIEAYKADCQTLGNDDTFNNEAEQYFNKTFKSE